MAKQFNICEDWRHQNIVHTSNALVYRTLFSLILWIVLLEKCSTLLQKHIWRKYTFHFFTKVTFVQVL